MASRKRTTLEMWVKEQLIENQDGPLTMIVLAHMVGQSSLKDIFAYKFTGGAKANETELADLFRGKAEAYSQDSVGVQMFQLMAFFGESKDPKAFQPFSINVQADTTQGIYTEPATADGMRAADHRRHEMIFQQMFRKQEHLDNALIRHGEILERENSRLRTENLDMFSIFKEMQMQQIQLSHEQTMAQQQHIRTTEERKKLLSFAPVLVNTILGREIFPQSMTDTILVEQIADSLGGSDIEKLSGVLPPTLWGPLANRLEAYQNKKNEEAAAREKLLAETPIANEYDEEDDVKLSVVK